MKGVKNKTLTMLNQLGMSDDILTLIERRSKQDLMIFFAMGILTLVFIYVLFYYVKPYLRGDVGQNSYEEPQEV